VLYAHQVVGALLFNLAFALPVLSRLAALPPRGHAAALALAYAASLWQAATADGSPLFLLDAPLAS
tara:strand:+ start:1057 stop:1254 length:198 start_codon:yes stop_codon:yes gene_type:complete